MVKKLIANLPLRRKFLVLGLIAMLMLALPATLILSGDLRQLTTAQMQSDGLAPARAAVEWIRLTQQHRGLSAVQLGGGAGVADRRAGSRRLGASSPTRSTPAS